MAKIDVDELTDEQIEAIINTRGFQKMLGYSKLAEGVAVLKDEDEIFQSLVETIRKRHSQVSSTRSVEEFFELFVEEVETFTEPLVSEDGNELDSNDLEELYVEEGST